MIRQAFRVISNYDMLREEDRYNYSVFVIRLYIILYMSIELECMVISFVVLNSHIS